MCLFCDILKLKGFTLQFSFLSVFLISVPLSELKILKSGLFLLICEITILRLSQNTTCN